LLAEGFEELEAITILDVLRRAEIDAQAISVGETRVVGAHGIPLVADRALSEAISESWDAVILPGGLPGAHNLRDDPQVQKLVQQQNNSGGRVAAICAAPIALASAGILEGRRATCYPGFEDQLGQAKPTTDRVVIDGNVTTSRGPGTAIAFALTLVEQLRDPETAASVRDAMLVAK
jgi:4-methyl-5(b-hydroxyethyl)-thiazole monophosphate biosynthesis